MKKTAVPNNIQEITKLDQTIESFLKVKGVQGMKALSQDKSLNRISNKIRNICGPLTKIWQQVERTQINNSAGKDTTLNLQDVALKFQHIMMLMGQAINATTFYRRKSALLALGNKESDINSVLRETHSEDFKQNK